MAWERFLAEGKEAVRLVCEGLRKRGINAGDSIITPFNTDEDPTVIIWYCLKTNVAWGAITPVRPSTKWIIFPDRYGVVIDKRKTASTVHYLYPSYCVPPEQIISKNEVIKNIQELAQQ